MRNIARGAKDRYLLATTKAILIATLCVLFMAAGQAATLTLKTSPRDITSINTGDVLLVEGQADGVKAVAEGALFKSQPGEPDIAWQLVTVLLPPNADLDSISVRLENAVYKTLDGNWQIEPTPPMGTWDPDGNPIRVWPEGKIIENGRDVAVYNADAFWPAEDTRLNHTGRLHQWQLAEVAVPLVRYNPVTGEVKELLIAAIVVNASRRGREIADPHAGERGNGDARRGRNRVREMALNFRNVVSEYDAASEEEEEEEEEDKDGDGDYLSASTDEGQIGTAGINSKGYAIITTAAIVSSSTKLANFVTHKQSRGWTVTVATEAQWGGGTGPTGAVNIRNWLRANYISKDILYVLLIGNPHPDSGDVPMRWYDDGQDGGAPTDNMYSDLSTPNGWDKYWEVIVGRIPSYGTISVLDNILKKTINYESSQNVLWRRNVLLPMVPLDGTTPVYQCGEQIRSSFLIPNGITSTRIYDADYGVSPEYIRANRYPATEWKSKPYGYVAWLTHGSQTSAQYIVNTGDVSSFNNNYPSATYQGSCQNAWPENSDNLAFRILQNGGINTVAATRNSYYNLSQTNFNDGGGSIGNLAYRYSRNMIANRQSCGVAISNAKQENYVYPPNATRMTTFGDPSLVIFVDPDFTPPTPNPMTWNVQPYENGPGAVTMTAATAVDNAGSSVEYYFLCVSGGGRDSGWQSSPTYTDTQVTQLVNSYRVKARDTGDNLNQTAYSAEATVTIAPYAYDGQVPTIPNKIQAHLFDGGGQGVTYHDTTPGNSGDQFRTREDVDIVAITDGQAGYAIDNIENGEWLLYTVNSIQTQTDLYARVASTQDGGQILVWLDDVPLATLTVPNTGSLTTWATISVAGITLPDRQNARLKLEFVGSGFRLNWFLFGSQMPYLGTPAALPGRLEFENFDIGGMQISYYDKTAANSYGAYRPAEAVDIIGLTDGSNGYTTFTEAAEWLEYTCAVERGYYTLVVRSSSYYAEQQITLSLGEQTLAAFTLPNTGGYFNFRDTVIPDVFLPGGETQVLRFSMLSSSGILDYVDFIRQYNAADINGDGQVDMGDFAVLAGQWMNPPAAPSADSTPEGGDGVVDLLDLLTLADNWLFVE